RRNSAYERDVTNREAESKRRAAQAKAGGWRADQDGNYRHPDGTLVLDPDTQEPIKAPVKPGGPKGGTWHTDEKGFYRSPDGSPVLAPESKEPVKAPVKPGPKPSLMDK